MDTLIERKPGINRKRLYWVGGVMLGLAVIAYFIFRDTASSMAVEKDRLTIATVEQAEFSDYIRVIGLSIVDPFPYFLRGKTHDRDSSCIQIAF